MRKAVFVVASVAVMATAITALAQDPFGFMPKGGAELLAEVLSGCARCEKLSDLATRKRTAEEWRRYFDQAGVLSKLSAKEVETLTRYLAVNFPARNIQDARSLPRSGRAMVIQYCSLCHSMAVPMTQARDPAQWQGFKMRPPHDTVGLSSTEWEELANYLAINAPIPVDRIPEQLRQGAGGY